MEKLVVRMLGGLGNQLFIYSYVRGLREKYPDARIFIDLGHYKGFRLRTYCLSEYKLGDISILKKGDIAFLRLCEYRLTYKLYHLFRFVFRAIYKKDEDVFYRRFCGLGYLYNANTYCELPDIKRKTAFVYGYFQSVSFFCGLRNELKREFTLKSSLSETAKKYLRQISGQSVPVGISVRCGEDYERLKMLLCGDKYYAKALDEIIASYPDCKFFVFSDDLDRAKRLLGEYKNLCFVEGCSPVEALFLLSNCRHFIIANSSFSWWGAYLSDYGDKCVIAPEYWFPRTKTVELGLSYSGMKIISNEV